MKLAKQELFKITNIPKADLVFLLEVIDKVILDEHSSELARRSLNRWKLFKKQIQTSYSSDQDFSNQQQNTTTQQLTCDGCEVNVNQNGSSIEKTKCPATEEVVPLCHSCFKEREGLVSVSE